MDGSFALEVIWVEFNDFGFAVGAVEHGLVTHLSAREAPTLFEHAVNRLGAGGLYLCLLGIKIVYLGLSLFVLKLVKFVIDNCDALGEFISAHGRVGYFGKLALIQVEREHGYLGLIILTGGDKQFVVWG